MGLSYCAAVRQGTDKWNQHYHDTEYGFPLESDDELFERLMLEINQAGLSWLTILKKRDGFQKAYDGFSIAKVAAYGDEDRAPRERQRERNHPPHESMLRHAQQRDECKWPQPIELLLDRQRPIVLER